MSEQYYVVNIRVYLDKNKPTYISETMAKKLARVSILDAASGSYTTAAYLIAQLGKNYALPKDKRLIINI